MAYHELPNYQISFPLFKVSEPKNSKCLDLVLVQLTPIVQKVQFLFHAAKNQIKKITPIEVNGIEKASVICNYFPLFKVSEP